MGEIRKLDVFKSALGNQRDVTESFYVDAGHSGIDVTERGDQRLLAKFRHIMEERGILRIPDVILPEMSRAQDLLERGNVAAVDGTNFLAPTNLLTAGIYACATGFMTSQTRGGPQITITQTVSSYIDTDSGLMSDDDLIKNCDELDASRQDVSWPTTFREYQERKTALQCGASHVLLDGPVFTQNLLSQQDGRALYDEMSQSGQEYIGVIKESSAAYPMIHWCAMALRPGEAFIVQPVTRQLSDRFKDQPGVLNWVRSGTTEPYVRVVYCLNVKPFAIECRREIVPLALAIVVVNASPTLHHETPLLMEMIDARLRSESRSDFMRKKLINRISNLEHAIKLMDERGVR
jgi:hypothetical protein